MSDPVELVPVVCNNCGAPLSVPTQAEFVTCNHCGSNLSIKRTGDVTYTELLGELNERTEQIAEEVETLKVQNEIQQLELDHRSTKERLRIRTKHGYKDPTATSGVFGCVIGTIGGVFALSNAGLSPLLGLFGIAFIAIGWGFGIREMNRAGESKRAEADYRRRRRKLEQRLKP